MKYYALMMNDAAPFLTYDVDIFLVRNTLDGRYKVMPSLPAATPLQAGAAIRLKFLMPPSSFASAAEFIFR